MLPLEWQPLILGSLSSSWSLLLRSLKHVRWSTRPTSRRRGRRLPRTDLLAKGKAMCRQGSKWFLTCRALHREAMSAPCEFGNHFSQRDATDIAAERHHGLHPQALFLPLNAPRSTHILMGFKAYLWGSDTHSGHLDDLDVHRVPQRIHEDAVTKESADLEDHAKQVGSIL